MCTTPGGARDGLLSFSYNADDELLSTGGGYNNRYSYDANGEQIGRTVGGVSYTLSYDFDGELTGISSSGGSVGSTYDALGRRFSRTVGGVTTRYVYDAAGQVLLEEVGNSISSVYTWGVDGLVPKDGEYPLVDGLGSERVVTNSSQGVTARVTYDAFGNVVARSGSSSNPYQFAGSSGYRNDRDTGLTYIRARYYDAKVGRFITRDTYLDQKPYLYCEHDPVNCLDPDGHKPKRLHPRRPPHKKHPPARKHLPVP